jgi:protein involved in polysaccharide export with SLBB domain
MVGLLAVAAAQGGCAALSNPVADGIPVRRLPTEVFGKSRSDLKQIDLTVLKQREPDPYQLDKGDVLAVVAEELIAPANTPLPVRLPDAISPLAATGFPVPVNDDGTISIPRLPPLSVKGKSVTEVERLIRDTATGKLGGPELLKPAARVSVQLLQKRTYAVTVVREDVQPVPTQLVGGAVQGTNRRGNGFTIRLPAGENDVLRALNATGGPPGLDAKSEVTVLRGNRDAADPAGGVVRIPLRVDPTRPLAIREEDIILGDGDVVLIEARDTEVYYVAGVAGSRQFPLPRDYDLDVFQALSVAGAPLANGGFTQNAFIAQSVNTGLGSPSPALVTVLRQDEGSGQQIPIRVDLNRAFRDRRERIAILPGDIIVMQERPGDAIARYLTQTIRVNNAVQTFQGGAITGGASSINP